MLLIGVGQLVDDTRDDLALSRRELVRTECVFDAHVAGVC